MFVTTSVVAVMYRIAINIKENNHKATDSDKDAREHGELPMLLEEFI